MVGTAVTTAAFGQQNHDGESGRENLVGGADCQVPSFVTFAGASTTTENSQRFDDTSRIDKGTQTTQTWDGIVAEVNRHLFSFFAEVVSVQSQLDSGMQDVFCSFCFLQLK